MKDKAEELRDATREANGILKDLRREKKELRELMDELKVLVAEQTDKKIEDEVKRGLEQYYKDLKQAMDEGVDHILKQFDELHKVVMTGNKRGRGKSLRDFMPTADEDRS